MDALAERADLGKGNGVPPVRHPRGHLPGAAGRRRAGLPGAGHCPGRRRWGPGAPPRDRLIRLRPRPNRLSARAPGDRPGRPGRQPADTGRPGRKPFRAAHPDAARAATSRPRPTSTVLALLLTAALDGPLLLYPVGIRPHRSHRPDRGPDRRGLEGPRPAPLPALNALSSGAGDNRGFACAVAHDCRQRAARNEQVDKIAAESVGRAAQRFEADPFSGFRLFEPGHCARSGAESCGEG